MSRSALVAPFALALALAPGCVPPPGPCPSAPPPLPTQRLTVDGQHLRDQRGRQLILRGFNLGGRAKAPPFFPFPFVESGRPEQAKAPPFAVAAQRYAALAAGLGANVARVPFTWEAVEPTRGRYDDTYLTRYLILVDALGAAGLAVIVDLHQDAFARPYCGDGFPLWAVSPGAPPIPKPEDCGDWFQGYLKDGPVEREFDRFWRNDDHLQDAFVAMWRHVAARAWPHDAVIGFEVMNEPHPGTADAPTWERDVLTPFYNRLGGAIREAAPGALIFFDATGLDGAFNTTYLRRPDGEGFVFAPHFYEPGAFLQNRWSGQVDLVARRATWAELGALWKLPVLIGEFGINQQAQGAADYLRANYDALDAHLLAGTLWEISTTVDRWNVEDFTIVGADGALRPAGAAAVRVQPRAIAGALRRFVYRAERKEAELAYVADGREVSELWRPERLDPKGIDLRLTVDGQEVGGCHSRQGGRLRFGVGRSGQLVEARIAPAP